MTIADGEGHIFFYNTFNHPPELISSIRTESKGLIRSITMDRGLNYLVTAAMDGFISIFDMPKAGKERLIKQVG